MQPEIAKKFDEAERLLNVSRKLLEETAEDVKYLETHIDDFVNGFWMLQVLKHANQLNQYLRENNLSLGEFLDEYAGNKKYLQ